MKFQYTHDAMSKSWTNPRYTVTIQRAGPKSDTFIVFVSVSDRKDDAYDPIHPRFEVRNKSMDDSIYQSGAIAEALVREMTKLPEDAKLSEVRQILGAVSKLLQKKGLAGSPQRTRPQIVVPGSLPPRPGAN